jgi:hypothetical protein
MIGVPFKGIFFVRRDESREVGGRLGVAGYWRDFFYGTGIDICEVEEGVE